MSNPQTDPFGAESFGYPQQSSRCKIIIHSHVNSNQWKGVIDCTADVIACDTSKTIKGGGQASFVLVPRKNYLNLIFPDDYVNIYFDPGDGRGFVRTFFGFVDRVGRSISTDSSSGATTTRFQVQCSDFTKAFDRTQLYFNPHIARRKDLFNEWAGGGNIGGVELRVKGVAMHGSPADIVLSLVHLLLGFYSQYMVPKSLTPPDAYITKNRQARAAWARERLPEAVLKALGQATIQEFEQEILAEASSTAKLNAGTLRDPSTKEVQEAQAVFLEKRGLPAGLFQTQEWRAAKTIYESAAPGVPVTLIDLIDFRYVEWKAIDGYVAAASVWRAEGSLWGQMNSWSNEILNELFCDLRPMPPEPTSGGASSGGGKQDKEVSGSSYGREADELGGNTEAVRFAPCLVMREHPFGTIEGIDPPADLLILKKQLGLIYIGALFSKEPGIPGRKTVSIPAMHPMLLVKSKGQEIATKHLDVSVISVQDIIQENIGRSDADHVNLIEVYSDLSSGPVLNSKFLTQEVQPIITATNVMRHGLRVRTFSTKFARFTADRKYADAAAELKASGLNAAEIERATKDLRIGGIDTLHNRRLLIRWAIMMDHWYQHNLEYLTGTMTLRAFPEIRVGYRLDVAERCESYYVEGVNHSWTYPNALLTTLTLSRGQRNDPFPVYVMPGTEEFQGMRHKNSRLGQFFHVLDTSATARSVLLFGDPKVVTEKHTNLVDIPSKQEWARSGRGFLVANSTAPSDAIDATYVKIAAKIVSGFKGLTNKALSLLQSEKKPQIGKDIDPDILAGDTGGGKIP